MKLLISTSNKDKLREISQILGNSYQILTKKDFDLEDFEVEEDATTLEENSYKKAKALQQLTKENVIADDTGLFVEALNGQPGIYAARYAGENATYQDNNEKLLKELENVKDLKKRNAYFETVICLVTKDEQVFYAKGRIYGYIAFEPKGTNGFGYNPIFILKDYDKTMAEISSEKKNDISQRAIALKNLKIILKNIREE